MLLVIQWQVQSVAIERETTNISRRKLGAEAARQPEQSSELKKTTKSPESWETRPPPPPTSPLAQAPVTVHAVALAQLSTPTRATIRL